MHWFGTISENSGRSFSAVGSGVLLAAAFPGISAWYTAWGALVLLFFAVREAGPGRALGLGFLAGFAHYLMLLYWLVPTMRVYGGLPLIAAAPAFLLLAGYLALYPAVFAWFLACCCRRPVVFAVMAPLCWVALEYIRSVVLSGFPWGLLGYSQYARTQLIQIADIFGVYGISGLVVAANSAVFLLLLSCLGKGWQGRKVGRTQAAGLLLCVVGLFVAALFYGNLRLYAVDRRLADAEKVDVALVQANIEQMQKWDAAFRRQSLEKHFRLSQAAENPEPELIVWPETAVPFYFQYRREATEKLLARAGQTGAALLVGAPSVEREGKKTTYYNSAYLISPEGEVRGRYDKVHLVPFGEYVPFRKWLFFIDTLVVQVGDFESGSKGNVISRPPADIGMLICYEAIFPELSAAMTKSGAAFLVNITNDAWFGNTGAPRQHFSMAVLRAVENRRSLVRAANTGISGFIDPAGRIRETTPLFEEAVKSRSIALIEEYKSFYTRYTDVFAFGCLIATAGVLMLYGIISGFQVQRRREQENPPRGGAGGSF